jgi:hypothetical protein
MAMTLYDECRYLLRADFTLIEGETLEAVIALLNQYPFERGNVLWERVEYIDYETISELLRANSFEDDSVFVLADDASVPVFKTNIKLIADYIYDVLALSSKMFIFNSDVVMQPLYPGEAIRLAKKIEQSEQ